MREFPDRRHFITRLRLDHSPTIELPHLLFAHARLRLVGRLESTRFLFTKQQHSLLRYNPNDSTRHFPHVSNRDPDTLSIAPLGRARQRPPNDHTAFAASLGLPHSRPKSATKVVCGIDATTTTTSTTTTTETVACQATALVNASRMIIIQPPLHSICFSSKKKKSTHC